MKKYGTEHFHVELVEETDNPEEREQYWIKFYNSYGSTGYNATMGGDSKKYIDYDEIVRIYQKIQNVKKTAEVTGHDPGWISQILKNKGIKIASPQEVGQTLSKSIAQYTKDTHEFLQTFNSTADAARWCYENKKCPSLCSGVRGHIAQVANGKRKSAYGYVWKYN